MNYALERILNNPKSTLLVDGRKVSIEFSPTHLELSTTIMLEVEVPCMDKILESIASINLLKWAEQISLDFEPSTSAITLYQTIPSHPHHFEEILSEFLEIATEWEEILLSLT